jgi:hypothetical protein
MLIRQRMFKADVACASRGSDAVAHHVTSARCRCVALQISILMTPITLVSEILKLMRLMKMSTSHLTQNPISEISSLLLLSASY